MNTLTKREQVWLAAWVAWANGQSSVHGNTTDSATAADICLAAFDKRFPTSTEVILEKTSLNG